MLLKSFFRKIYNWLKNRLKDAPLYGRTLVILFIIAFIVKWIIVFYSHLNSDPRENVLSYAVWDIFILFIVHLLLTINFWINGRGFRMINNIIIFLIFVLFVADIFAISFFHTRLMVVDMIALWSDGSSGFGSIIALWVSVIVIVWIIIFLLMQKSAVSKKYKKMRMTLLFSISTMMYALVYIMLMIMNINVYTDNVVYLNLQNLKNSDFNNNDTFTYKNYITSVKWEAKDLNIILVFAESLSPIDSAKLGWNDNMPYFDMMQEDGITYPNFIANWMTSDTAHIATLLWVMPLANMRADNTPYSWYRLQMEALPEFLNSQWYATTFISTASLGFLNQRNFLSWAGFQKIIWEEEFESKRKYTFDAAPDGDLYDRVLDEIQAQTWKYFIWLQTISFHKPYNSPKWKTEKLALKYSDEELYEFYQWLQEIWFFDDGILIVVWDHRKMTWAQQWESEILWDNRASRTVATVIGSWVQPWTVNSNIIQHTDFYNSIKRLVGKWDVSLDYTYNNAFWDEINRERWITKNYVWGYKIMFMDGEVLTIKNVSNMSESNDATEYLSAYSSFEFWNDEKSKRENLNGMMLIWHRWAPKDYPENTLESFLEARKLWAMWIEFDVSYTKDKQNIVVHGEWLSSSDCSKRKVRYYTHEWINENCTIRNWEKYRTLQQMLGLVDGLFDYYFVELKVYDERQWTQQALDAIQTVKDLNMQDRVIFISYSEAAREVLAADSDIIFGWDTFDINDLDFIWENNSKYFLAPYDMLTPEVVQKARDLWKEVVTYTVNDIENYQVMKDLWIKIIMTDRLDILQEYENAKIERYEWKAPQLNLKKSSKVNSEDLVE